MEWRSDITPARAGDAAARERLREYLTPFVHGVCLAHAPHHRTHALIPAILTEALNALGGVEDLDVGTHVMSVARRRSKEALAGTRLDEQTSTDPNVQSALATVARLRELPELARERFFLRMVDGIPGPELAEVARLTPGELRAELERSAADAARLLGQGQSFASDDYLWELAGAPNALLARLEMQLPTLRFDPLATPPAPTSTDTAGTQMELKPVGSSLGGPMRGLVFDERDDTSVGEVSTEPGVESVAAPVVRPVGPNPFEKQLPTIAASDLPAEAKGSLPLAPSNSVPWNDPGPSSKSGKMAPLPPRPVPNVKEGGEASGKSQSGKSGRQQGVEQSNKSGRQQQVEQSGKKQGTSGKFPLGVPSSPVPEVTKDGPKLVGSDDDEDRTESKVPEPIARQAPGSNTAGSGPVSVLGQPTMEMSLAQAIQGATRLNPIVVTQQETRVAVVTAAEPVTPPPPKWTDAPLLQGTSPFFAAAALAIVGVALWSGTMFANERQLKSSWQLVPVIVAAEDLNIGDPITLENVAVRSVPEPFQGKDVVKGDALDFILDQKLAVAVQVGDPLFYAQFVSARNARTLSSRISKKGRGYTIATNVVNSVGQNVKPGDVVDVLVSITDSKGKGKAAGVRSVTLLQHVRVMATGKADDDVAEKILDERDRAFHDVTLLLTASEAEVLALGASLGRLVLTLRSPDDDEVDLDRGYTNIHTLLEGDRIKLRMKNRAALIESIRNSPIKR